MADRKSLVLEIVGILIALIALAVSLGEAYRNRDFNKISVMPLVSINDSIYEAEQNELNYKLEVYNRGLGPAVIKWLSVSIDHKSVAHWSKAMELLKIKDADFSLGMLWPETAMANGEWGTQDLLIIKNTEAARSFWSSFRKRGDIQICYCSLYGECRLALYRNSKPVDSCEADKRYVAKFTLTPDLSK